MPQPKGKSRPLRDAIPPKIVEWLDHKIQAIHDDFAASKPEEAHIKIVALDAAMRSCHYYDDGTIVC